MYGLKQDWELEPKPRHYTLDDYVGRLPRWCTGCGDHSVLGAVQRLAREEQMPPEKTVFVSGIGCSSRFPHYMKTYGFHGLHGRPLPVACGVRSRRPDLNVFVVTGDGDCCAIGTAHWIHAIRYNMKMVVMMLDNHIYGLTKMQTSPTSPLGTKSNTHPWGPAISPINPISVTLGISNASFVAQTIDWNPPHVYETLKRAYHHDGLAFVRVLQRCPHYMPTVFDMLQNDPTKVLMMKHENGIAVPDELLGLFKNNVEHDPADLSEARDLADRQDVIPIGLFYHNENAERYDAASVHGMGMTDEEKLKGAQDTMDRFLV
jgi:2-oxoglutarate ferredoxin oxidoreductase subunit beta